MTTATGKPRLAICSFKRRALLFRKFIIVSLIRKKKKRISKSINALTFPVALKNVAET